MCIYWHTDLLPSVADLSFCQPSQSRGTSHDSNVPLHCLSRGVSIDGRHYIHHHPILSILIVININIVNTLCLCKRLKMDPNPLASRVHQPFTKNTTKKLTSAKTTFRPFDSDKHKLSFRTNHRRREPKLSALFLSRSGPASKSSALGNVWAKNPCRKSSQQPAITTLSKKKQKKTTSEETVKLLSCFSSAY